MVVFTSVYVRVTSFACVSICHQLIGKAVPKMNKNGARVNPLSRRPRKQRLVMAVRGGAGVGKTYFAASMADAGLGRLCIIDIERKTRLLKGVGSKFDGIEVERPSEVPEFIDWLLNSPEAAAQNYECYALDSWASYFSAKHSEMIAVDRERPRIFCRRDVRSLAAGARR